MSGACDVCWDLAYARVRALGGTQQQRYLELLAENKGEPHHDQIMALETLPEEGE